MEQIQVRTPNRECLVDITAQVADVVWQADERDGLCTLFITHTTAGLTVNENADPDVCRDIIAFLSELVPRRWPYRHAEGNSDAHIKASLMGCSVQIPIHEGRLVLGTWQGIYLAEFDGPRNRSVRIVITGR